MCALAMLPVLVAGASVAAETPKIVAGWLENVQIFPGSVVVRAKLDTGATLSSLDCDCITPYMRDGEEWVSFGVRGADGKITSLERKVLRRVKIKRHFGETQERLVVRLGMCLADRYKEVDVTLVDRSGFNYPLLVGRNFLHGNVVVDSDAKFTTKPNCPGVPRP